ncbi:hypothetical protein [Yoonia litorea]|uniref:Uncharacterized protein n=1 Tax=Yoonia litorea TaxID=1123755 RepID=A0A1I6LNA8_9RHOB|nr:hypothetical protein [Yoonia litorea]SFS04732.1 hypothetical protein SAMN05444714_0706 [Yoonia litorea]
MDTSLNLNQPTMAVASVPSPTQERANTTKVSRIERADGGSATPPDRPFVAQVVNARLDGAVFPENPSKIAPPERTLRPYDVPMLPFDRDQEDQMTAGSGPASQEVTSMV